VSSWAVADAAALIVGTEALVGVPLVAAATARVAEPTLLTRAMDPGFSWRQSLIAGAHGAPRWAMPAAARRPRAGGYIVLVLAILASTTALALGSQRFGIGGAFAAVAGMAALVSANLPLRAFASRPKGVSQARRLPHVIGLGAGAEAASLIAISAAVLSVATASQASALIPLEVASIVITARLVQVLGSAWAANVALAAAALVLLLGVAGLPADVGLAAALLWWGGWLLGGAVLFLLARQPMPETDAEATLSRDGGRLAHRAAFAVLSMAPGPIRDLVRRRLFDSVFAVTADPWDYAAPYERRKQQHLVASLRGRYSTIVEVGCADGHNVAAVARACPEAMVLGTDVSALALDVARRRTQGIGNAAVVTLDEVAARLGHPGQVECIVLAEVLYYLVTPRAMRAAFGALAATAGVQRDFLMLHGASDGRVLHRRAARALGLDIVHEQTVEDPVRPFVLTVARTRSTGLC
jgi:hypothetical protein